MYMLLMCNAGSHKSGSTGNVLEIPITGLRFLRHSLSFVFIPEMQHQRLKRTEFILLNFKKKCAKILVLHNAIDVT